ncbi:hypothetical protein [Micromonospora sp. NPDC049679]|uniref:hypothetical protein n=1 Tax=Micromonospora sp. NPDC049679 TaxID=3155920 RepID=UPI0033D28701
MLARYATALAEADAELAPRVTAELLDKHPFEYAVIRAVPRIERGEQIKSPPVSAATAGGRRR